MNSCIIKCRCFEIESKRLFCRFVALYNYKPQKEDEVELKKGDYYSVAEACQDGWLKGRCLKTGKAGVFPGNYVQPVRSVSQSVSQSETLWYPLFLRDEIYDFNSVGQEGFFLSHLCVDYELFVASSLS